MTAPLYLVRIVLDRRALARIAARHRLPTSVDDGYLLHAGLSQLFATSQAPADVPLLTFAVDDVYAASQQRPELLFVLGYAEVPDASLMDMIGDARKAVVQTCKSQAMPRFEAGQRLGFRTRACPIVRTKIPGSNTVRTNKKGLPISREIDAFLHATLGVSRDTAVSREDVYRAWLKRQVEANGATSLEEARLAEFRREVMHRKGGGGSIERPDAVLVGELSVTDPTAFAALLARGVGRHRAFGYGMLLLRPPAAR